jgi:hypothetical protein
MKKIIIAIIALLCCGYAADAQIKVSKKSETRELYSAKTKFIKVCDTGSNIFLALASSNQFDDIFLLHLGESKKEALESLASLWEIAMNITKGENYEIETLTENFSVYKGSEKDGLRIYSSGYAGYASINASELKEIIDALRKQ